MTYAVIMAGGIGSRFWPRSRAKTPKQLLNIFGDRSMIQQTVDRVTMLIGFDQMFVVTNILQAEEIGRQLPDIPKKNILIEPVGRNTAPCIGLAAMHILKHDPEGVMAVLAADHLVKQNDRFCEQLAFAVQLAKDTEACITLGIQPDRPVTGYGYIQFIPGETIPGKTQTAFRVNQFTEKPNLEKATQFLQSGHYLWNSGIFIWKAKTILRLIEQFLPDLHSGLTIIGKTIGTEAYEETLREVYHQLKPVSIDFGVMEKAPQVYVVKGDFGWSDVGSWEEVYQILGHDADGNVAQSPYTLIDTNDSLFFTKKYVAAIGIENIILVETEDAILLCRRDQAQNVKQIVDDLEKKNNRSLL
jgi:mannose-1-phosphate guanylyltransferase